MSQRDARPNGTVIPIQSASGRDACTASATQAAQVALQPLARALATPDATLDAPLDELGRPLEDLRISVTDRCNFRCTYCMPRSAFGPEHRFLPHRELLSFEEITRTARLALGLGVRKLRLTGGEPLLRKDLEKLVEQLSGLRTLDGQPPELTLTTNGTLLVKKARALREAGLQRVTVSLDALTPETFARMSDTELKVEEVLAGIDAARAAGLGPVKVNMVVQKGVNDNEILPMAAFFKAQGIELRYIEFMDVGQTNRWQMAQVLTSAEVRTRLAERWHLLPLAPERPGDTAERWIHADGSARIGFISSVSRAFCRTCTRLRLSTDGRLYTCLFTSQGHDLRSLLRDEHSTDADISARIAALWRRRSDRYSELRGQGDATGSQDPPGDGRIEMSYIGG